jgi:hypothetical protein
LSATVARSTDGRAADDRSNGRAWRARGRRRRCRKPHKPEEEGRPATSATLTGIASTVSPAAVRQQGRRQLATPPMKLLAARMAAVGLDDRRIHKRNWSPRNGTEPDVELAARGREIAAPRCPVRGSAGSERLQHAHLRRERSPSHRRGPVKDSGAPGRAGRRADAGARANRVRGPSISATPPTSPSRTAGPGATPWTAGNGSGSATLAHPASTQSTTTPALAPASERPRPVTTRRAVPASPTGPSQRGGSTARPSHAPTANASARGRRGAVTEGRHPAPARPHLCRVCPARATPSVPGHRPPARSAGLAALDAVTRRDDPGRERLDPGDLRELPGVAR